MPKEALGIAPETRDAVYPAIAPENLVGTMKDKVVLITGAGRGIGKAIALAFAQAGAHIALLARTESQLLAVAEEISTTYHRRSLVLPVDVADTVALTAAFEKTEAELGKVDIVVANAGITVFRPFIYSDFEDDCWKIMEVNFKSPLFLIQLALRSMKNRNAGVIIAITSLGSVKRVPTQCLYTSSKAALNTAIGVIQVELDAEKESGIHLYSVSPGVVRTEIISDLNKYAEDMEKMKPGIMKWWSEFLKLDAAPPELCAQTCVYLATGKAKELRGRYIDSVKDIESVVAQAEIVKKENLYDMGIKELGE